MKKLQNFANQPEISNSTYAGEAAADYIAAALLSARTLDNNLVTIKPNVKFKEVIQKVDVSSLVSDASCDFVASASASIEERILTPKELQVNLQLCKQEFVDSWNALQLGYSAFDEIPRSFNDFLVSYVGGKVAEKTETDIWQGSTATNGEFGGFENAFSASAATLLTTAVQPARSNGSGAIISGSITAANVVQRLSDVYDTISSTVYGKEDLVIYIGSKTARAYQSALSGLVDPVNNSYNNQLNVGEKPLNFQGIELVLCPGMSDDKIAAAQKSNLFFGTGLLSDHNEVRVLDMANLDGSQNYRIIMRYTAGTQFGVGKDIVYFGAF
tara:strand:+ start:6791 stop:7774 length:984 start_codon:yes stop_codon:yes gene_type:complete